jgi:hypothetical protein
MSPRIAHIALSSTVRRHQAAALRAVDNDGWDSSLVSVAPEPLWLDEPAGEAVARAFGEANRRRLLDRYFANVSPPAPNTAWLHIYRLLLWINRTIGLAHCYESDKCQPGKPWYPRSLAFHGWLAAQLGTTPADLAGHIDLLFKEASGDLAAFVEQSAHTEKVLKQRRPFEGQGFPEPGDDPELISLIVEVLGPCLKSPPPEEIRHELVRRVFAHVTQENKRKNLIGEGFEDTIAAVLSRIPAIANGYSVMTRPILTAIGGFNPGRENEKPRQVDLALVRRSDQRRILITAKWSVRADREEQFMSDFRDYSQLEARGTNFDYVLVTNEFDAARLVRACERRRENADLFTNVVHVNPEGPRVAYDKDMTLTGRNASRMDSHIKDGRLASIEAWLTRLATNG